MNYLWIFILCLFSAIPIQALDIQTHVDQAIELIESEQYSLARSYLAPALIHPGLKPRSALACLLPAWV